ncbi:putative molybdenum carrier protein [Ketobacter nezhaii]|uniref:putative molybdenum carrier protein n=1 Tax=Ketobacter sp. MCCC 1A13808 TaxID=2602738 RepID=UPI0018DDA2C8|nr:putative molybdenum carrier protein [Ketobacter sp. MCCC 1A13808]
MSDRAALDAGLKRNFPIGGACPVGRMAEDGAIDLKYPLEEIGGGYRARTRKNVEEAQGTVLFYHRYLQGGTELTAAFCIKQGKPYKLIDIEMIDEVRAAQSLQAFITDHHIEVLNVAGPRHSGCPAMYSYVKMTLDRVINTPC